MVRVRARGSDIRALKVEAASERSREAEVGQLAVSAMTGARRGFFKTLKYTV